MGIWLFSSHNNTLRNNVCPSGTYGSGIRLEDSNNNSLISNHCLEGAVSGSGSTGIYLLGSGNILRGNRCFGMSTGIRLEGSHNVLKYNICSENYCGMTLTGSGNVLANNTVTSNINEGIELRNSKRITLGYNICQFNEYGISLFNVSESELSHNTITGNEKGIWIDSPGGAYPTTNLSAHDNNIFGNTEYGVDAAENDDYPINATNNWWGEDSGPYHQANNTAGTGDNITDFVEFDPWLQERINRAPAAHIDSVSPGLALEGTLVRLSASGIDDTGIDRYIWSSSIDGVIYAGPLAGITLSNLSAGHHTLTLRVQDEDGVPSDEVTTTITVHSRPLATTITISPELALDTATIAFTGEGQDDGAIVRYVWTSSIDGEFHNGSSPSFTSTSLSPGAHTIHLRVQDDHGAWSEEITASLLLHTKPRAYIDSMVPSTPIEGEAVRFLGSGMDDGSITRYLWTSSLDGELYDGGESELVHPGLSQGEHVITLKVQDDHEVWSEEVSATLTVTGIPEAVIRSIRSDPVTEGDEVEFSGKGVATGSITGYAWRSSLDGEFYNGTRKIITHSGLSPGTHTIYLKVRDNNGIWSEEVEDSLEVKEADREESSSLTGLVVWGVVVTVLVAVVVLLFMYRPGGGYDEEDDPGDDPWEEENQQEEGPPGSEDQETLSWAHETPPPPSQEPDQESSHDEELIAPLVDEEGDEVDDDDEIIPPVVEDDEIIIPLVDE